MVIYANLFKKEALEALFRDYKFSKKNSKLVLEKIL